MQPLSGKSAGVSKPCTQVQVGDHPALPPTQRRSAAKGASQAGGCTMHVALPSLSDASPAITMPSAQAESQVGGEKVASHCACATQSAAQSAAQSAQSARRAAAARGGI